MIFFFQKELKVRFWIEGSTLDFPKEVDIKNLLNGDRLIICDILMANGDLVICWMDYELGISSIVSYSKIKWPAGVDLCC